MDPIRTVARTLLEGGPLALELGDPPESWTDAACDPLLARVDALHRAGAPGDPPVLDLAAARYGLGRLAHLAWRLVDRSTLAADVAREFAAARDADRPDPEDPGAVWSVDLALQRLPELERYARGLVPTDPLLLELRTLARAWPLSAPALAFETAEAATGAIGSHPALARLLLDRLSALPSALPFTPRWAEDALAAEAPAPARP